jgi:hypothetical protein
VAILTDRNGADSFLLFLGVLVDGSQTKEDDMKKTLTAATAATFAFALMSMTAAQAFAVKGAGVHNEGPHGIILAKAKHKYAIKGVNVDDEGAGEGKNEGNEGKEGNEGHEGAGDKK